MNILRSDAGLMTTREAARNPIYAVLSGPSGGVAGALFVASKAGFDDILTFDMGGTSTDVALCQNGQPTIGRETAICALPHPRPVRRRPHGRRGRRLDRPRARADEGAPRRAASRRAPPRPGRATAGAATLPTVTDANVVLGHLPPQLLGGEMALDVEAAPRGGRRRSPTRWASRPSRRPPRGSSRS